MTQPPKPTSEQEVKDKIILKDNITYWARHEYGLDDDDCVSAGDAYEMLEAGILHFLEIQRQQVIDEERERILNLPKMQLENVGLPTTQQAEQNNYDKKIRNQLRRMIENETLALKGK